MKLIDTHCHLNFDPLAGDLGGVLQRAKEAAISHIIAPSYDLDSWPSIEALTKWETVYAAYGLHPWVADQPIDFARLRDQLQTDKAIAVGEIGLDFKIESPSRTRQVEVLNAQLDIAERLDLPVLLHCRGAFTELIDILKSRKARLRGVLHAFSRGPELAARFLGLGLHLAFGGAVTRKRAERAKRSAALVPPDKLLLETDAPAIGLDGVDPHDVEPRHVRDIASAVAILRGTSSQEIAEITTRNACRLFGLP